MKVTHIFKTYFPDTQGGLEEAIRQISKAAIKASIAVRVVSLSKNPKEQVQDGIETKSYYTTFDMMSTPFSWNLVKDFRSIVKNSDIIHLQFPWPTAELLTLFFNVRKPIVLTFHCDIHINPMIRMLYVPFIHAILRKSDVIVPTSYNLQKSTKLLKKYQDKCKVVNLWIDEDRFDDNLVPSQDFAEHVNKIGDFCLFVGVLRWYKGIDVLLDAAKKVNKTIVIVGKGPLYNQLNERIENEKIGNVLLMGYQSDANVKYLLSKCKFFVLPSVSPAEAFGQVLLEASFYKKAMISTELGTGTSYVNLDKETGHVIPPNNVIRLIDAINHLFDNPEVCRQFGENAYHRLLDNFTLKQQAQKYLDIYQELYLNSKK